MSLGSRAAKVFNFCLSKQIKIKKNFKGIINNNKVLFFIEYNGTAKSAGSPDSYFWSCRNTA